MHPMLDNSLYNAHHSQHFRQDTIHVLDSVFIRAYGDTVYVDRLRTEWREKVRIETDTVYIDKVVKEVIVKSKIPAWCWWNLGILVLIAVIFIIRFGYFKKKQYLCSKYGV